MPLAISMQSESTLHDVSKVDRLTSMHELLSFEVDAAPQLMSVPISAPAQRPPFQLITPSDLSNECTAAVFGAGSSLPTLREGHLVPPVTRRSQSPDGIPPMNRTPHKHTCRKDAVLCARTERRSVCEHRGCCGQEGVSTSVRSDHDTVAILQRGKPRSKVRLRRAARLVR